MVSQLSSYGSELKTSFLKLVVENYFQRSSKQSDVYSILHKFRRDEDTKNSYNTIHTFGSI
jgi:hypothetical protein